MALLELLKSISFVQAVFWLITFAWGIKGYMEYPYLIEKKSQSKKTFTNKPSLQQ